MAVTSGFAPPLAVENSRGMKSWQRKLVCSAARARTSAPRPRAQTGILSQADEATATLPACSCMAMLALMVSVTIYKQPGSFWEYRMFDLIYPARLDPGR